jgi:ssDNA-binding replication factor A large subunit
MIQIPYQDMITKIKEASSLSEEEIEQKVQEKCKALSGLISKDGAAHIVANELGVKLLQDLTGKIKIDKILPGMRTVETVGKVVAIYEVREFQTETREGKVGSMIVGDETGTIRVTCWGDQTAKLTETKVGDIVRIKDGYVRENRGNTEVHLNDRSLFQINPNGETITDVKASMPTEAKRTQISDLKGDEGNVELLGTVVQAFEPKFFEVCPDCGGRARPQEDAYNCVKHGTVTEPDFSYLVNIFLDDGTDNIRTVFFRDQVDALLSMKKEEILKYKDAPETFETVKQDLLGKIIKIVGRAKKNEMFDRLEFAANQVDIKPDPEAEIKRLEA